MSTLPTSVEAQQLVHAPHPRRSLVAWAQQVGRSVRTWSATSSGTLAARSPLLRVPTTSITGTTSSMAPDT